MSNRNIPKRSYLTLFFILLVVSGGILTVFRMVNNEVDWVITSEDEPGYNSPLVIETGTARIVGEHFLRAGLIIRKGARLIVGEGARLNFAFSQCWVRCDGELIFQGSAKNPCVVWGLSAIWGTGSLNAEHSKFENCGGIPAYFDPPFKFWLDESIPLFPYDKGNDKSQKSDAEIAGCSFQGPFPYSDKSGFTKEIDEKRPCFPYLFELDSINLHSCYVNMMDSRIARFVKAERGNIVNCEIEHKYMSCPDRESIRWRDSIYWLTGRNIPPLINIACGVVENCSFENPQECMFRGNNLIIRSCKFHKTRYVRSTEAPFCDRKGTTFENCIFNDCEIYTMCGEYKNCVFINGSILVNESISSNTNEIGSMQGCFLSSISILPQEAQSIIFIETGSNVFKDFSVPYTYKNFTILADEELERARFSFRKFQFEITQSIVCPAPDDTHDETAYYHVRSSLIIPKNDETSQTLSSKFNWGNLAMVTTRDSQSVEFLQGKNSTELTDIEKELFVVTWQKIRIEMKALEKTLCFCNDEEAKSEIFRQFKNAETEIHNE